MAAISAVRCPVLGGSVRRVTNVDGRTTTIVCAEYAASSRECRLKANARRLGVLPRLLERVSGDRLDTYNVDCDFLPS